MTPAARRPRRRALVSAALLFALLAHGGAAGTDGDGYAGSSGTAALDPASGGSDAARAAATLPGIDVSHWQGEIDWQKVAASGQRFVFMKSTDATSFVDPRFRENRAGAKANGLKVGFYHFARPGPEPRDPIKEARHFIRTAKPVAGELLPVLDIESTGGLDPDELTRWARRWVREVELKTGVTALVYTSPYFWRTYHADTRALARDGSLLWIAHWGVSAPSIPARNWDGRGWKVWQYTSTGRVSGIVGDVDRNHFAGTHLGSITIRRLTLTATGEAGRIRATPIGLSCRTTCARNVNPGTEVTLRAVPDDGAHFTGWSGACEGTDPTCTVTMSTNRAATANFLTDITPPTATIIPPARHARPARVDFDEAVRGVSAANVALLVAGTGQPTPAIRSCRSAAGAVVSCTTGNVRTVLLVPTEPLTPGLDHRVAVNPAGARPVTDRVGNPAVRSSATFTAARGVDDRELPVVQHWRTVGNAGAFGGTYAVERLAGATVAHRFGGSEVTWYTLTGPAQGKAEVLIDGRSRGVFDGYAPAGHTRVARTFRDLGSGPHTITVRALGRARAAAHDTLVAVDAFGTRQGIVRTPATRDTWHREHDARASGGTYAVADLAGASVTVRFRGTGIDWTTVRAPNHGRAKVFLDGALLHTVDLFADTRTFGVVRQIGGLDDGIHTLRIVATGTARAASHGSLVAIDRVDVRA